MLRLLSDVLDVVHRHAAEAYPSECCGILLGTRGEGTWIARRALRARNLLEGDPARDRYEMDPDDRLCAERNAREAGLDVIGFYHSHPDHEAYFSETDFACSEEARFGEPWVPPTYAYLVLSVREGKPAGYKGFIVREGRTEEIPVRLG